MEVAWKCEEGGRTEKFSSPCSSLSVLIPKADGITIFFGSNFSLNIVSTRVLCAYFILALAYAHGVGFRGGQDCGPSPIRCPGRATLASAVKLEGSGCRYH